MSQELTLAADKPKEFKEDNRQLWRPVIMLGYLIIILFFGVFGIWAAFAPLGSGAIAQGQLQVDTNQKIIQHLEGGIIAKILVREGQEVKKGQVLVELDQTDAKAQVDLLTQRRQILLARGARLDAERDGSPGIKFPKGLVSAKNEAGVRKILNGQQRLFEARRRSLDSQVSLLDRRIAKAREEIRALSAEQNADRKQLVLIEKEIVGVGELVEKGLERKPRLYSLMRTEAKLEGSIDNRKALISRAEQGISEIEYQLVGLLDRNEAEVETEMRAVQEELLDTNDRLTVALHNKDRTEIRAPQDGRVYNLNFHTIGGVVSPGEVLMGIIPKQDSLMVRVRVEPTDIDVVEVGAEASVRLTAFSQRTSKPLDGKVVHISADLIQQPQMPPFYEAYVELDQDMLARQGDLKLVQGMPAMAIISTGEQTLLEYIISPIARSLETALREN